MSNPIKPIAIIGMGEMGGVFARGFLKAGYPVYPITRQTNLSSVPDVEAVIVAVGEKDLQPTLTSIPDAWRQQLILLQNELLPKDWQKHQLKPTVISVWFEKKWPSDFKVIIPSPVYGPQSQLVKSALESIKIPVTVLNNEAELLFELVVKNLYILTINIAGLEVGGTTGELWEKHQALGREVANDILDIQFVLIGKELDREKLIAAMLKAFNGDLKHTCMGRSAPARLARALSDAAAAGLDVKTLKRIASNQLKKVTV